MRFESDANTSTRLPESPPPGEIADRGTRTTSTGVSATMAEPTPPHEPLEILLKGAIDVLAPCEKVLRERGWDATKVVHDDGAGVLRVCLEIRIAARVPIENVRPT